MLTKTLCTLSFASAAVSLSVVASCFDDPFWLDTKIGVAPYLSCLDVALNPQLCHSGSDAYSAEVRRGCPRSCNTCNESPPPLVPSPLTCFDDPFWLDTKIGVAPYLSCLDVALNPQLCHSSGSDAYSAEVRRGCPRSCNTCDDLHKKPPQFEDYHNIACRGDSPSDTSGDYYLVTKALSLEDCKSKCHEGCFGVEFVANTKRCELWNREINSGELRTDLGDMYCSRKKNVPIQPKPCPLPPICKLGDVLVEIPSSNTCPVYECGMQREHPKVSGFDDFEAVACRGHSPSDNSEDYYTKTSARSLDDCKSKCGNGCFGVEFVAYLERCELWTRKINSGAPRLGVVCSTKSHAASF